MTVGYRIRACLFLFEWGLSKLNKVEYLVVAIELGHVRNFTGDCSALLCCMLALSCAFEFLCISESTGGRAGKFC
jgi:hypothetical protein